MSASQAGGAAERRPPASDGRGRRARSLPSFSDHRRARAVWRPLGAGLGEGGRGTYDASLHVDTGQAGRPPATQPPTAASMTGRRPVIDSKAVRRRRELAARELGRHLVDRVVSAGAPLASDGVDPRRGARAGGAHGNRGRKKWSMRKLVDAAVAPSAPPRLVDGRGRCFGDRARATVTVVGRPSASSIAAVCPANPASDNENVPTLVRLPSGRSACEDSTDSHDGSRPDLFRPGTSTWFQATILAGLHHRW